VCAKDQDAIRRNVSQFLDEDGAFCAQSFDNKFVMHDFMAHIDGRTVQRQSTFHYFDGAIYAGAKSTRISEQ
jgi:hypothetical protein